MANELDQVTGLLGGLTGGDAKGENDAAEDAGKGMDGLDISSLTGGGDDGGIDISEVTDMVGGISNMI